MSKTVIVIPSRYASTRLPGKPLAQIAGQTMLQRVIGQTKIVKNVDQVIVATDDQRIYDHAVEAGATAMMTPESCANGTERCLAAVQQMDEKPDIIINRQGDAPLIPASVVQALVDVMQKNPDLDIATPAIHLTPELYEKMLEESRSGQAGGTTVTFNKDHWALYFSKTVIPFVRKKIDPLPVYKHLGVYAYRYSALEKFVSLPQSALEQVEGLEQLRALENGMPIKVVPVDIGKRRIWSVDNPDDVKMVEKIITEDGEL